MGVCPQGAAVLPCQAEVTDFEVPLVVVQDVGGLQVSVDDPVVVQVAHACYQLPHQRLDLQQGEALELVLVHGSEVDHTLTVTEHAALQARDCNTQFLTVGCVTDWFFHYPDGGLRWFVYMTGTSKAANWAMHVLISCHLCMARQRCVTL